MFVGRGRELREETRRRENGITTEENENVRAPCTLFSQKEARTLRRRPVECGVKNIY